MKISSEIREARIFYVLYVLFAIFLGLLIMKDSKADLHLQMTSMRSGFADVFFTYYTQVGEWVPYAVVVVFLFFSFRNAALVLAAQLLSGIFSKILKYIFNEPRPMLYFQEHYPDVKLNIVQGVHVHLHQSFPSGHTVTAFAFFAMLILFTNKKSWHVVCFLGALLVGISRIYLQQHFAIDVLVGSGVGVLSTLIVFKYKSLIYRILPKNKKSLWYSNCDD